VSELRGAPPIPVIPRIASVPAGEGDPRRSREDRERRREERERAEHERAEHERAEHDRDVERAIGTGMETEPGSPATIVRSKESDSPPDAEVGRHVDRRA